MLQRPVNIGVAPLVIVAAMVVAGVLPVASQAPDPAVSPALETIRAAALQGSQVMEVAEYLTDVYGPRLTGSPNFSAAGEYAVRKLTEWDLVNAALEPWGPFGRGWSNERFYAHVVAPQAFPIVGYPKAWTPGTKGLVRAEAVMAVIEEESDFERFRGKLRGKLVLTSPAPEIRVRFSATAVRHDDDDLAELEEGADQRQRPAVSAEERRAQLARQRRARELAGRRLQFFLNEGAAAIITPGTGRGDAGALTVQSGGPRDRDAPPVVPQVVFASEQYARIARLLALDIPVTLELQVENRFYDETLDSFNVVAEIPGTDKADELVMLGAHLDSWHAGTGATDNAAGAAVMMEAVRILQAAGLPLRRTVRLALWGGEEQGLLGSTAYVREHFADRDAMTLKPEHEKLSAYFNLDNGTGKIRGIYLQGNDAVGPIFRSWMQPLAATETATVSPRSTGATDHVAFDQVGLPGFEFVQDPIEYFTRTHHTNLDLFDRLIADDLRHNAMVVAWFVYQTATRDEPLPRTPLPRR